jgi:D-sedoheptulose 7-phosphate isomerase
MDFTNQFLAKSVEVIQKIDRRDVEAMVDILAQIRDHGGRLFLLGSGGGAGHASHATCDFRKLCNIQAYAPYDNISELTARVNDEGWDVTLSNWLRVSRLNSSDCLLIFSVGGGNATSNISMNLVNAVMLAKQVGAKVVGVVGRDGGFTKEMGDAVVVIPNVQTDLVTPLVEGFQALVWHMIVSHPKLQVNTAKWEGEQKFAPPHSPEVTVK